MVEIWVSPLPMPNQLLLLLNLLIHTELSRDLAQTTVVQSMLQATLMFQPTTLKH